MESKTIIVTGGAQGIGRAIVERCIKDGCHVLTCDKNENGLKALSAELSSSALATKTLDVTDASAIAHFFSDLNKTGYPYDGLVNNAGIFVGAKFVDYSVEDIDRVLNTNGPMKPSLSCNIP